MNFKMLCLLSLVSFSIIFGQAIDPEEYNYRPYPVLFVHGYIVSNISWGTVTAKGESTDKMMTTYISGINDNTASKEFTSLFENITDFAQEYEGGVTPRCDRFVPWEEKDDELTSYTDLNHTYVELYCVYKYNESVDGDGAFKNNDSKFTGYVGCGGDNVGYDISAGGLTQLLRIRVIQMLNEYYGDFKWVNDPTARIKIIAKSQGGQTTTNLLKNEGLEGWYNSGMNGQGYKWEEITKDSYGIYKTPKGDVYRIDGYGFNLADHIDQVITVATPFGGIIWDKPTIKSIAFIGTTVMGVYVGILFASGNPLCIGLGVLLSIGVAPAIVAVYTPVFNKGVDWIAGEYLPGWNDLIRDGKFQNKLRGDGLPPAYSYGGEIPYTNIYSTLEKGGLLVAGVGAGCFVAGALLTLPVTPFFNTFCAGLCFIAGAASIPLSITIANSDIAIFEDDADMKKSLYPSSSRKLAGYTGKNLSWSHVNIHEKMRGDFPKLAYEREINKPNTELEITHVIGTKETKPFIYKVITNKGNENINNEREGIQFLGMNPDEKRKWRENIRDNAGLYTRVVA